MMKKQRDQSIPVHIDYIVVADNDPAMRQMLVAYLEKHNVPVKPASNKIDLNRHFEGVHPSLIILDLRLDRDDGLNILREIRSRSDIPVIVTAPHRSREIDGIVGLELGADDYILKPFCRRELLARIRAVLRRQERGRAGRNGYRARLRFRGWRPGGDRG